VSKNVVVFLVQPILTLSFNPFPKIRGICMKIVVLSDIHLPKRNKGLPARLIEELRGADLTIHAGDWQTLDVYKELQTYARVEGVYGNVDNEEIVRLLQTKKL
jgi:uncharacterized protein